MDWEKISAELSRKLDPAHVRPPKKYGPKGDYIEGWHAMAEANRIFGFDGWDYHITDCRVVSERPREIGQDKRPGFGVTYVATVQVVVGQARRQDVGSGHGYDVDCGLAHESAIKEAVTDALKRALRSFGNPFGLALYDKSRENVGHDLPPFDAVAAESRIIEAINKRDSEAELKAFWKAEAHTVEQVGGEGKARIIEAFKARKGELTQDKAA